MDIQLHVSEINIVSFKHPVAKFIQQ